MRALSLLLSLWKLEHEFDVMLVEIEIFLAPPCSERFCKERWPRQSQDARSRADEEIDVYGI